MRRQIVGASSILAALAIAGCANVAQVDEQAVVAARESVPAQPLTWTAVQEQTGEVQVGWVDTFEDPLLSQLVVEAQQNNRNLQAAAANVDSARALAVQAGAALKPLVGLSAGGQRSGAVEGGAGNNFNIGVQASWEADVWGRIRSGEQAASASFEAVQADYRFSQHSLAAGVAQSYFIAIEAQLQVQVAQSVLESVGETRRIVQVQLDNGIGNAQDLALVNADFATATEQLTSAQAGQREAVRSLELLLGRYPAADLEVRETLPDVPEPPGVGVPAEVLERRPDLIAAERRIAAALNLTNQAKTARLPQISLTASLGGASSQLSSLLNPANLAWQAAGSLLAPLFDGGALQAQVEAATADQKATIASYAQAALVAFGEVENALDQQASLSQRRASLEVASRESQTALRLANLRFKEGEGDLLDVLTVQQRVDAAKSNLLSVRRSQLQQLVELNLALGGDWRSPQ